MTAGGDLPPFVFSTADPIRPPFLAPALRWVRHRPSALLWGAFLNQQVVLCGLAGRSVWSSFAARWPRLADLYSRRRRSLAVFAVSLDVLRWGCPVGRQKQAEKFLGRQGFGGASEPFVAVIGGGDERGAARSGGMRVDGAAVDRRQRMAATVARTMDRWADEKATRTLLVDAGGFQSKRSQTAVGRALRWAGGAPSASDVQRFMRIRPLVAKAGAAEPATLLAAVQMAKVVVVLRPAHGWIPLRCGVPALWMSAEANKAESPVRLEAQAKAEAETETEAEGEGETESLRTAREPWTLTPDALETCLWPQMVALAEGAERTERELQLGFFAQRSKTQQDSAAAWLKQFQNVLCRVGR
jgi:hypothetical protein